MSRLYLNTKEERYRLIILLNIRHSTSSIDGATFGDFLFTENESLATFDGNHSSSLASTALKFESDLLCGLCLLSENGFGLTSITCLLGIISSLSLGDQRSLSSFVLRHFVYCMLLAFLTVSFSCLGSMDLFIVRESKILPFYFLQYIKY